MVGRCISYWNSPFLGDMLIFRGAPKTPTLRVSPGRIVIGGVWTFWRVRILRVYTFLLKTTNFMLQLWQKISKSTPQKTNMDLKNDGFPLGMSFSSGLCSGATCEFSGSGHPLHLSSAQRVSKIHLKKSVSCWFNWDESEIRMIRNH